MAGECEQLGNFGVNYSTISVGLQAFFRRARARSVSRRQESQYFAFGDSPWPGSPHTLQTKCFIRCPITTPGREMSYGCMICSKCSISNIGRSTKEKGPEGPRTPSPSSFDSPLPLLYRSRLSPSRITSSASMGRLFLPLEILLQSAIALAHSRDNLPPSCVSCGRGLVISHNSTASSNAVSIVILRAPANTFRRCRALSDSRTVDCFTFSTAIVVSIHPSFGGVTNLAQHQV